MRDGFRVLRRLACVVVWVALLAIGAAGFAPGFVMAQVPPLPTLDDAESGLTAARAAAAAEHWPEADRLVRAYVADHQISAEGHALFGLVLLNELRPKESLAEYTHAAQLERPTAADFRAVALDYVLLNSYPDADKWMSRSVEENGADSESWYEMGRIKYTENRFAEAAEAFRKSLALRPRSVKAENNLGLTLDGLGKPEDAVRAYRQAIAWQAEDPHPSEQPYLNLGLLLSDRNELDPALVALVEAERLAPADSKVHGGLGKLYRRRGELAKAEAEFELAVGEKPEDAALHFELAQVYRRLGRDAEAKAQLARVAALNGTHSSPE